MFSHVFFEFLGVHCHHFPFGPCSTVGDPLVEYWNEVGSVMVKEPVGVFLFVVEIVVWRVFSDDVTEAGHC